MSNATAPAAQTVRSAQPRKYTIRLFTEAGTCFVTKCVAMLPTDLSKLLDAIAAHDLRPGERCEVVNTRTQAPVAARYGAVRESVALG